MHADAKTNQQQAEEFLVAAARNYKKHQEHLRIQKLRWQCVDAHDADDLLNETILKCYDKISRSGLTEGNHYFTYLNTAILYNTQYYSQKRQRNRDYSLDRTLECLQDGNEGGPNPLVVEGVRQANTAAEADQSERHAADVAETAHTGAVVAAFEQLPQKYQELLLMDVDGLKYKEMCRVLGLTMGQCKMRIKTGRDIIKAQLGAYPKSS